MTKYKNRICERCKTIEWTASKSLFCRLCAEANVRDAIALREQQELQDWGYKKLKGPTVDKFNHRVYTVLTHCGHEWTAPYTNILKQQKLAKEKSSPQPCPICGGKRRMKAALDGFMNKYARDYDLKVYEDFTHWAKCSTT